MVHFDLKPSDVLLDDILSPKIKSFGLEKFVAIDETSTRGTSDYSAPEMLMEHSQVTYKADVYSLGMIMFEVLGMRSTQQQDQHFFPQEVWEKFVTGQIEELIEDCGITKENREDAKVLSMVALWCVQYTPSKRPSMRTVVNTLEKILPVIPPPYPFQFVSDDDLNKEAESESILKLYERKCPPGSENSVIFYTSTIEKTKRLFKESNDVRTILQSHQIKMIERDVWGDMDYYDELNDILGKIQIPVLFVKGRLIGAAAEVKRLEAKGKLRVLLYGIPTEVT